MRSKSNFPNFKSYGFSIVIHNFKPQAKELVETFIKEQTPSWSVVSLEPYPDKPGHHIHIFLKWKTQRRSIKWFNFHNDMKSRLVEDKPADVEGEWGRIQVDSLKGDKESCLKYLVNPDKDKPLGDNVKLVDHSRLEQIDRWAHAAAYLGGKFIFPQTHGHKLITIIEYLRYLEEHLIPIPESYSSYWNIFKNGLKHLHSL